LPNGGEWPGKEIGEDGATLGTYLPGREPDVYGNGLARKIPAGSVLQFQIHYNGDSLKDDASDLTSVGFIFAKEPPRQQSHRLNIGNKLFLVPAVMPIVRTDEEQGFLTSIRGAQLEAHVFRADACPCNWT